MHWNNRIFKQDTPQAADGEHIFFIGELYYNKQGKPKLHSSIDHNLLMGSSTEELQKAYSQIAEAFKAPVIELAKDGNFKGI